ncbi:GntR family transcriptional regulator, partial [Streptomyces sp. AF1A]|uniref:GntR family transcriptional regulator n=1 Tax=Streptomyces sp. AF1A TaxID=3394350 RepID=UPI0039BD54B0
MRTATSDQGPKPCRPQAVAGKVSEKEATPRAASAVPSPRRSRGAVTAIGVGAVALLCFLMDQRSSVDELAEQLRRELDRYSPGGKLPSSRALVERFRVSPVTVSRALAQL